MKYNRIAFCFLFAIFAIPVSAEIISEGILGNSGEHGDSLIKTSQTGHVRDTFGMVYDRGTIWASAGTGRINRYSLDGRQLATFPAPRANHRSKMSLVGDKLVMVADRKCKLYLLDINAEPGTKPEDLKIEGVTTISPGSKDGQLVYVDDNKKVYSLDVNTRQKKLLGSLPDKGRCGAIEMLPDGSIYVEMDRQMGKFINGKYVPIKDGKSPGGYLQFVDGAWYGHVWHGTIRKYQKDFTSKPGVVYGGNSGSFIGHVRSNEELSHGRYLAKIGPDLFVTSGIGDVVFILDWDKETQRFNEVRRIGSLTWHRDGIAMNDEGDILVRNGRWHWQDGPDTPFYETVGLRIGGQLSIAPDNNIVGPGLVYDTGTAWIHGPMDKVGAVAQRWIKKVTLRKGETGTVAYLSKDRKRCVLTINKKGEGVLYHVDGKWMPQKDMKVELKVNQPVKKWNNLAMRDKDHLLASADGQIIEFVADGDNWKEVKRWNKWGEKSDQKFGDKLFISLHKNLLWVADTTRHRVLCFDEKNNQLLGQFGKTDQAGTGLDELDGPTGICSRGLKAALIDGNNERVVKLSLKK